MIRPAQPEDVDAIVALIGELAEYERLTSEMEATSDQLAKHLFQEPTQCSALVATVENRVVATGDRVVGYALFFPGYTTFKSRRTLFLEDLYVTPEARGRGHGKALLTSVAAEAVRLGCARMDWNVLDWNRLAIDFYQALGAELLDGWRVCRVQGAAMARLAGTG